MDVNVVGGGPGGLYAALLLQKERPDWEVTVYERDPADNTYGWGVVFSDATLSALREADHASHERITDAFVRWDPIDVHYEGQRFRCGGHTFAGIMRADLLGILQDRAAEVGVEMHHETPVEDPTELAAESDLVIGADGLNSQTREVYEDSFRPRIREGDARFAWFGTDKPFDVFTFVFRENEHGLWQVHAYPGRKSTFIVECQEDVWRAAGMDEKNEEEALAYFEDLFSDHLGEHELLSKLYAWRNFPVVETRNWYDPDDGVLLLGDAAHTAHFTIGSGTKMAMEDAIALWEGVQERGEDFSGVASWYEKERRPRVEGLQDAAERSREYFEHVPRYQHLDGYQFAFNLLTRSGRISYDELRIRDPGFVDGFDRWFAGQGGEANDPQVATPPMFEPCELRDVTVPNRIVLAPTPSDDATDGLPGDEHLDAVRRRGTAGAGLVLTDPVAVSPQGRITPGTPGMYDSEHCEAWSDVVADVHDAGETKTGLHLVHAGRRGATKPREYGLDRPLPEGETWELLAPSPKPYTPASQEPTAMDAEDLARVKEEFVRAAEMADEAGFDLLQLHWGHGYLLSSFLSPITNERDDEYGGDLAARARYPLEVYDAVREAWPDDRPLSVTLPASDWGRRAYHLPDAFRVGGWLKERDCDLVAVVAGQTGVNDRPKFDPNTLADYTEAIRNEVEIPTMSTNYVSEYDDVNTMVGGARADLCRFYPESLE